LILLYAATYAKQNCRGVKDGLFISQISTLTVTNSCSWSTLGSGSNKFVIIFRALEVSVANLNQETDFPDWDINFFFSFSKQNTYAYVPQVQTGQLSSLSSDFIIYLILCFKDGYFILETENYIK